LGLVLTTQRPLFEGNLYTIDFTQIPGSLLTILTIKSSLKLIGTNLGLQFQSLMFGGVTVFSVSSGGGLYFEVISNIEEHFSKQG